MGLTVAQPYQYRPLFRLHLPPLHIIGVQAGGDNAAGPCRNLLNRYRLLPVDKRLEGTAGTALLAVVLPLLVLAAAEALAKVLVGSVGLLVHYLLHHGVVRPQCLAELLQLAAQQPRHMGVGGGNAHGDSVAILH